MGVEYSKNPVSTGEAFLLRVSIEEVFATWGDLLTEDWASLSIHTWEDIRRKVF
jgi:hypothetical protein